MTRGFSVLEVTMAEGTKVGDSYLRVAVLLSGGGDVIRSKLPMVYNTDNLGITIF